MILLGDFLHINSVLNESDLTEIDFQNLYENKPIRKSKLAIIEGRNQIAASNLAQNLIGEFSITKIKELHKILYRDIDNATAGRFRTYNDRYGTSNFEQIQEDLNEFCCKINEFSIKENVAHALAFINSNFLRISPFVNGNEQVARFLSIPFFTKNNNSKFISISYLNDYLWICNNPNYDAFLSLFQKDHKPKIQKDVIKKEKFLSNGSPNRLLKIGEVALWGEVPVSTVRYWMSLKLISPEKVTDSNQYLFRQDIVSVINLIKKLQKKGKSLDYIKNKI